MLKLNCPACGADVIFKSYSSIFGVCSFCQSTLIRHDKNLEDIGKMSEYPQDLSPLQMGTLGIWNHDRFEIIGRQRISWEKGSWNEWYLIFESGKDGWLADAQGLFVLSFSITPRTALPLDVSKLKISDNLKIEDENYQIEDMRNIVCLAGQGELPQKSVKGRKSISIDLIGSSEKFANIDYSEDGIRFYQGQYVEFDSLQLKNLREIDGW